MWAAAKGFGPAGLGVFLLLRAMVIAAVWKPGFRLPAPDLREFHPRHLEIAFAGFPRELALMTGVEIFVNPVAACERDPRSRIRKRFGSRLVHMSTTSIAMLVFGAAVSELSDFANMEISAFTRTMDRALPGPFPYLETQMGIVVPGSAFTGGSQGLQDFALVPHRRRSIPARIGRRNRFDVTDRVIQTARPPVLLIPGLCRPGGTVTKHGKPAG